MCCDVGLVSELRLTAGCVLMDLASPAVSGTSVYANGLMHKFVTGCSESKEVVYFYAAYQVHPVTCQDMCGLCSLSVCICDV